MFHSIMFLRILLGDNDTADEKLPRGVKMPLKTQWEYTVDNMQRLDLLRMRLSEKNQAKRATTACFHLHNIVEIQNYTNG